MLGHYEDARTLQQRLSAWLAAWQAICADMQRNPAPPLTQGQPGGGKTLVRDSMKAFDTVELNAVHWKWDVLRPLALGGAAQQQQQQ